MEVKIACVCVHSIWRRCCILDETKVIHHEIESVVSFHCIILI